MTDKNELEKAIEDLEIWTALANSIILSGERHSETSKKAFADARDAIALLRRYAEGQVEHNKNLQAEVARLKKQIEEMGDAIVTWATTSSNQEKQLANKDRLIKGTCEAIIFFMNDYPRMGFTFTQKAKWKFEAALAAAGKAIK